MTYTKAELEVVTFNVEDIITTSEFEDNLDPEPTDDQTKQKSVS